MSATNEISFYIPRISVKYNEQRIKNVFQENEIGCVKRVDFTNNYKEGVNILSAFIHMEHMNNTDLANNLFHTVYSYDTHFKFWPELNSNEYWLILKNMKPITETNKNIHQLVENVSILEEKICNHEETISTQNEKIENLSEEIKKLKEFVIFYHEKYLSTGKNNREEDESIPSLEDGEEYEDDDEDYGSMPSLISIASFERRKS